MMKPLFIFRQPELKALQRLIASASHPVCRSRPVFDSGLLTMKSKAVMTSINRQM